MSARAPRPPRNDQYGRYAGAPYGDAPPYGDPYEIECAEERPSRRARLVTPARVLLGLLILAAGAVALYGLFLDRSRLQIPLTVSGLAVFGLATLALAFSLARAAVALGRSGSGGRAFLAALIGGLLTFAASGSLAAATILGLLAASA